MRLSSKKPSVAVHSSTPSHSRPAASPLGAGVTTGPNFGEVVMQSWAAGVLFQLAAQGGNMSAKPTSAQILRGLYSLKGTTLGGLAAPITFHKGKPASNPCFYEMGIKNKKFVELGGGKPFCVPKDLAVS